MERIFAAEGKLNIFLGRIADLVVLNLLWLFCSLPVVTLGASTTALYTVLLKMIRNEESYICSSFFKAFKENFKQATKIWLGILFVLAILYFDFYFCGHVQEKGVKLFVVPLVIVVFIICVLYSYVFPIIAYFENTTKKAVKNAVLMGIAYLPYTAVILLVNIFPLLLLFLGKLVMSVFWDLVIGFSLAALINSYMFRKLFDKVRVDN